MAWRQSAQPKCLRLTRKVANEIASMTAAPHDRPLSERRLDVIKSHVIGKTFRAASFATAYCKETKQTYRVNGKHTSNVFANLNGEFPNNVTAVIETYECDTLHDVAALYSTFDAATSARRTGDINLAYAATVPEIVAANVRPRIINLCVTGMAFTKWEGRYSARPIEERAAALIDNAEFVVWVARMFAVKIDDYKHLYRGSVVAAMFSTYQKSKSDASDFWTEVRDGTNHKVKSPSRVLNKFLLQSRVKVKDGVAKDASESQRSMYVRCLHAWNAWRSNGTTDLKYYANAKSPVVQ